METTINHSEGDHQTTTLMDSLSSIKANSSTIKDWDHDLDTIPRLQVVDEHQKFT